MTIAKTVMISVAAMTIGSLAFAAPVTIDGKILKIDKASATVKIEHGPAMGTTGSTANKIFTYDYKVPNASMLDTLQVGDKVRFTTEQVNTVWTATTIQKQ